VVLVVHFPTGASIPHNGCHRRFADFKVRDESVFVNQFERMYRRGSWSLHAN
jgi:hypothetical protein